MWASFFLSPADVIALSKSRRLEIDNAKTNNGKLSLKVGDAHLSADDLCLKGPWSEIGSSLGFV
jgi:hypothetical protein